MNVNLKKLMYLLGLLMIAVLITGCKKEEYNIKVYTDQETYYTLNTSSSTLELEEPTREGYEFIGWFTDAECTEKYDDEIIPSKDLVIYAGWKVKKFTIQFMTDEGSNLDELEINYHEDITLPTPSKAKNRFGGWYLDQEFKKPFNLTKMPAYNLTLYVKWILEDEGVEEYKITYELNGGTLQNQKTIITEDDLPYTLPNPTRTGYVFDGWYLDSSFTLNITNLNSLQDYTLFAKWSEPTETEYTITYVLDGGNLTNPQDTFTATDLPFALPIPTKDGYEFVGWFTDASFTKDITQVTSQKDIIVYAKWKEIIEEEYTILYFLNGGLLEGQLVHFTNNDLPYTLPIPTKDGFNFSGWYLEENFTTKVTQIDSVGDKEVYAKWEEIVDPIEEYTITYHLNGGTLQNQKTKFTESELPIELATPTRDGYDFSGWYLESSFTTQITKIDTVGNKTIFAKWEEIVVPSLNTIVYNLNGGKWGFTSKEELATAFITDYYYFMQTKDPRPAVDLNTFMHGTGQSSGFKGIWAVDLGPAEGVGISYLYEANNFEVDPDSEYFINQPEYNAKWMDFFEMLEAFTLAVNEEQSFKSSPWTGNRRLYQYVRNEKPLPSTSDEIMNMLPEIKNSVTEFRSTQEVILSKPIRDGFIFGGWYNNSSFTGEPITKIPAGSTGTVTLYAKWVQAGQAEEYTITYNLNGGSISNHKTKITTADLPYVLPAPTRSGYDFDGWYQEATFQTPVSVITSVGNVTVYAKWIEKTEPENQTFTITYNLNGGKWYSSKNDFKTDFLTDFYNYLDKPGGNLNNFIHGAGKSSGFSGSWLEYQSHLYTANDKSSDSSKKYFINQPVYNKKWLAFFDFLDAAINELNEEQNLWSSPYTGLIRLKEYMNESRFSDKSYPTNTVKGYQLYESKSGLANIPTPLNDSAKFLGWYEKADFSGNPVTSYPAGTTGNKVLYAKWEIVVQTYTITYHLNGGTNNSQNSTHYSSTQNAITLHAPSRTNFRFDGWYTTSNFSGSTVTSIPKGSTGNKTFYAKWTELEITEQTHMFIDRANNLRPHRFNNLQLSSGKITLTSGATSGTYESPVINTKGFKSLVGSWSAITNSTNSVELQIRVKVGSSWSGYLSYGVWGLGRQNSSNKKTSGNAKIDVDVLSITSGTATAVQYKMILRRNAASNSSPQLALVGITFEIPNYNPTVNMSGVPDSFGFTVPKLNQNVVPTIGNLICSPTSITMLLKYKGKSFSDKDTYEHRYIAGLAKDHGANIYGNWSYNVAVIGAYGFNAYVKQMYSFNELKHHLHNHGPVAVSVKGNMGPYSTNGHLLVVRGVTVKNGTTYVLTNDPNISNVTYDYPLSTFNNVWRKIVYVIEK